MNVILLILSIILIGAALILSYLWGYDKGQYDLTKEIDEGIRRLKEEKENNTEI